MGSSAPSAVGSARRRSTSCARSDGLLDRYETRKVVFACPGALDGNAEAGILKAVGFELMWLKNKRDF